MFMKHYAPNRCELNIEVIVKFGVQWGGGGGGGRDLGRVDVNEELKYEELKFCENAKKNRGRGRGGGDRVDVNEDVKLL